MVGYRGNPDWRDMSEYAVHFTKTTDSATPQENLISILAERKIRAGGAFGSARNLRRLGGTQHSACFSEIPLDMLDRLIDRRQSSYGIGFHQSVLLARGGARVWYLDEKSELATTVRQLVADRIGDWGSPLWKFTPFIDQPFDAPTGGYRFEWEREWRVPGGMDFDLGEVAFLFAPEDQHTYLEQYITKYLSRNQAVLGPALVDPRWDEASLQRAFAQLG